MTKTIQIEHQENRDVDILRIGGELNIHSAYILEQSILNLMENGRYKLVINFEGIEKLASAGLGMFMARIEEIREANGDIKFSNLSKKVYHVFDLLDFPTLYDIFDEEEEAVSAFR